MESAQYVKVCNHLSLSWLSPYGAVIITIIIFKLISIILLQTPSTFCRKLSFMGYFSSSIINNFLILLTGIHTFSLEFSPLTKWHLHENFEILKKTLLVMCTVWSHKWPPIKIPSLRSEEDQIDDFGFYIFHSQSMTWKRIYVVLTFELVVESNNEKIISAAL